LDDYMFGEVCFASPGSIRLPTGPTEAQNNYATFRRRLEFEGVYQKDVGHDINVHITRGIGDTDEAVNDAWIGPQITLGVGCLLGVVAVIAIVRRLRPVPVAPGRPWPGSQ
jgi:hypothetical protein